MLTRFPQSGTFNKTNQRAPLPPVEGSGGSFITLAFTSAALFNEVNVSCSPGPLLPFLSVPSQYPSLAVCSLAVWGFR